MRRSSPAVWRKASRGSPPRVYLARKNNKTRDFNSFFNSFTWLLLLTAARERKRNEKVFETKNEQRSATRSEQHERTATSERTRAPMPSSCRLSAHCFVQCSRMRCELEAPAARLQCACSGPVHASRESLCPRSQRWPGSMGRPHRGQVTCSPAAMRFHHWARSRWCALP